MKLRSELVRTEVVGVTDLISSQVISVLRQQVGHFLHVDGVVKWRGVSNLSFVGRNLKPEKTQSSRRSPLRTTKIKALLIEDSSRSSCLQVHLSLQTLDQMADCHSGRDGVRVDDDVRGDSLAGEWHVLQHRPHIQINNHQSSHASF